jgi:hypothetical protein
MRNCGRPRRGRGRVLRFAALVLGVSLLLSLAQFATGAIGSAWAASPLNVFVGYMDTHSVPSSSKQPSPWPYTDPSSFHGSPCPNFPKDTTCWDASAVRLDNPGSADVTGVGVVVTIGTRVYNLWGANLTVKAHGTLVLTETGSQNSTNFDGSDYPPNAYNHGRFKIMIWALLSNLEGPHILGRRGPAAIRRSSQIGSSGPRSGNSRNDTHRNAALPSQSAGRPPAWRRSRNPGGVRAVTARTPDPVKLEEPVNFEEPGVQPRKNGTRTSPKMRGWMSPSNSWSGPLGSVKKGKTVRPRIWKLRIHSASP